MNIRPPETRLFADPTKRKRYLFALTMILLMVAVAELSGEKEIIFPEMAALTIGMWIVDKQVWRVSRARMVALMTAGAVAGVWHRALLAAAADSRHRGFVRLLRPYA